jgi:8-oxo-dGTP pyrophosphatase MutT (NUDIX family)
MAGGMRHSSTMSARARNVQPLRTTDLGSAYQQNQPVDKFIRLAHLRKLRDCEQVAAVCYQVRAGHIEFLLVRTRASRRWTFPKGGAEPGLTHAQAAALEAFEEAGVHGRIEEAPFVQYIRRKRGDARKSGRSAEKEIAVGAHLCEVFRLSTPKESNRDRTWFSVDDARLRLRERRDRRDGAQFARVVDKAVVRIRNRNDGGGESAIERLQRRQQLRRNPTQADSLHKIYFDFAEAYGRGASFMPQVRRRLNQTRPSAVTAIEAESRILRSEVLEFEPDRELRAPRWLTDRNKMKALGNGSQND